MQNCRYCCSKIAKKRLSNYVTEIESNSSLKAKLESLELEVAKLKKENFELKELLLENERKTDKMGQIQELLKIKFKEACKKHNVKLTFSPLETRLRYRFYNYEKQLIRLNFRFAFDLSLILDKIDDLVKFIKEQILRWEMWAKGFLEKGYTHVIDYDGNEFKVLK